MIGAGAAGLTAAATLSQAGIRVIVLEARDRIGGRIYTQHPSSAPPAVELGAEFVHGRPAEIWDIIKAVPLTAIEVPDAHWRVRDGTLARDEFWPRFEEIIARIGGGAGTDRSFRAVADEFWSDPTCADIKTMAFSYVEGFNAARADDISAQAVARAEQGGGSGAEEVFRLPDGYDRVAGWLRSQLDQRRVAIVLNATVHEVRWNRGRVEVRLSSGATERGQTVTAERAVITLPLGVLQAPPAAPGAVRFIPELASKRAALARLASGQVVRIVLRFHNAFWCDPNLPINRGQHRVARASFLHAPGAAFPTWWTTLPLQVPMLTAWAGGSAALALLRDPQTSVIDAAVRTLARLLGVDPARVELALEAYHLHDWHADPYALGAYSYVRVGGIGASEALADPVQDTLYFAGEAAAPNGQNGTVHGAIASGRRAAERVLASARG